MIRTMLIRRTHNVLSWALRMVGVDYEANAGWLGVRDFDLLVDARRLVEYQDAN